jgi:hypothetical protein
MDAIWRDDLQAVQREFTSQNVNLSDRHGIRPLQVACLKAYPDQDVVSYLLGIGGLVDFEVAEDQTLHQVVSIQARDNPYQADILRLLDKAKLNHGLQEKLPVKGVYVKPFKP